MEPVKEVEFGCGTCRGQEIREISLTEAEHLQEMMQNAESREKLSNSFITIQGLLAKPLEAQTTVMDMKDSKKKTGEVLLRSVYHCLQCQIVASGEDRDRHCQSKKHVFCK